MKAAKITVGGVSYFLVLDGEGMFQIRDDFGSTKLLLEAVEPDTREAFEATCSAAALFGGAGASLSAGGSAMSRGKSRSGTISSSS